MHDATSPKIQTPGQLSVIRLPDWGGGMGQWVGHQLCVQKTHIDLVAECSLPVRLSVPPVAVPTSHGIDKKMPLKVLRCADDGAALGCVGSCHMLRRKVYWWLQASQKNVFTQYTNILSSTTLTSWQDQRTTQSVSSKSRIYPGSGCFLIICRKELWGLAISADQNNSAVSKHQMVLSCTDTLLGQVIRSGGPRTIDKEDLWHLPNRPGVACKWGQTAFKGDLSTGWTQNML